MARRILLVWEHGGHLGHVARLLPIAGQLRRRGNEVMFAVADRQAAKRYLEPAGFGWTDLPAMPPDGDPASAPFNHAEIFLRCGFRRTADALGCIQRWWDLFEGVKPDAVLADASPLALYAARSVNLHAVALGHGFEIPPPGHEAICFRPWEDHADARAAALNGELAQALDALALQVRSMGGGGAVLSVAELYDAGSSALCTWPELDHFDRRATAAGSEPSYVGPIWSELPEAMPTAWPDKTGAKVLCYLNLRDKRHDLVWQALAKRGANVLVISPDGSAQAREAARGWGIHVAQHPILLAGLVDECDAVISHGGLGLTSMALHRGKRILLMPEQMEQTILAFRLVKQQLALATVRLRGKEALEMKVDALLAGAPLAASQRGLRRRYDGFVPDAAVAGVLRMLDGHPPRASHEGNGSNSCPAVIAEPYSGAASVACLLQGQSCMITILI